ncbi:MAG: phage major capsid protein [Burkholderiaceae bacterium]|jgi:HK97 family phage major capsid protein|nr:phage major capsid protein [Burkholderiaceae bacterium]
MDIEKLMKAMDGIEGLLKSQAEKADGELKTLGKVSADTKTALDNLGVQQRELADRLLQLEQSGLAQKGGADAPESWGSQVVKAAGYQSFAGGHAPKLRVEVKNTLTGSDTNVAPDRKPGVVPGAYNMLTLEALYNAVPTSSNAIEFTKEASFTNSAAEAAEGVAKAESALTWSLVNMPISTVAHWIKISRQLAMDNTALAAYVDNRMRYGVNRRVETQLAVGDGTAPNISGIFDTGNFTAHGYADAALGSTLKKFTLIRKVIADLWNAGYRANAIIMNAADWATMETEAMVSTSTGVAIAYDQMGPRLWGLRVVQSVGVTADTFAVGDFTQHGTIYNREGVVVDMSESDSDNFTKNLITLRAERRLALATEVPAAVRAGDLTPA